MMFQPTVHIISIGAPKLLYGVIEENDRLLITCTTTLYPQRSAHLDFDSRGRLRIQIRLSVVNLKGSRTILDPYLVNDVTVPTRILIAKDAIFAIVIGIPRACSPYIVGL